MNPHLPTRDQAPPSPLASSSAEATQYLLRAFHSARASARVKAVGLKGGARGYVLSRLAQVLQRPLVCIAADDDAAETLAADLAFFLGGAGSLLEPRVLRLPADDSLPYDELTSNHAVISERLGILFHLAQGTRFPALVLSTRALHRKVLPLPLLTSLSLTVTVGQDYERDSFVRRLSNLGYRSSPLVEDMGTYSVRGDILDVFSPLYSGPVRLEFFGDTLESMRLFDPDTQRTVGGLSSLWICPARDMLFTDETRRTAEASVRALAEQTHLPTTKVRERIEQIRENQGGTGLEALLPGFYEGGLGSLFDYLQRWSPQGPLFYLDDPVDQERTLGELQSALVRAHEERIAENELTFPPEAHFLNPSEVQTALSRAWVLEGGGLSLGENELAQVTFSFGSTQGLREAILAHHGEEGALTPLVDRLSDWQKQGITTVIACGSGGHADRVKRLLADRQITTRVHPEPFESLSSLVDPSVRAHLFLGELSQGFVDPSGGLAALSDEEIFGARAKRRVSRARATEPFSAAFKELKDGDLVVHRDFGVARYAGLTKMDVLGVPNEFLVLEYAGKDKIYLPVSRMRLVQKFTGGDPTKVALDKLGTTSWEKTKKRVKENLLKMAAELLQLYAARQAHPGTQFSAPDRYFRQFEADFEFEETPDQQKAIDEVIADMCKTQPMDRLVCGDVGYGKTEVAMRAAFKAVLDRKQVAVLVPTTVLAQQHFRSFQKRFADYPVKIDAVSGLRKPNEVREALKKAKEGHVDILIGTHKLLGADVSFKDLGLLVVDEEQRFGVKQKEQIKRLRTQVDVLTLTATPIPRTLHMSMSGVRDMSIIATPPQDRRAIRTFVARFNTGQIKEAIERELARGGQVFFVHNEISSIHAMAQLIRELCPQITLTIAHGQMGEGELEKAMTEFIDRKVQLLLCTAIIESGIDIPSANTMIVNRADMFGLAQLYQLRGRVGRSRERAYAYLLVPEKGQITPDAQRRLEVLQAFTELGAGFTIASHDLEIRGGGNLLGSDQSGSIEAIGFDMYAELMDEAVREMRGDPPQLHIEPDVNLPVAAIIPDDYVPDVHQRLLFYKRFSQASNEDELSDLRAELVDRYGDVPDEVDDLSETMLLKIDMRTLRLRTLESGAGKLVVTLGADALLDGNRLAKLIQKSAGVYRLTPDLKLVAKMATHLRGREWIPEAKKVLRDLLTCQA